MALELKDRTVEIEKGWWTVFPGLCKGCGLCVEKCPKECMTWSKVLGLLGTPVVEINNECIACGICQITCPDCAIVVEKKKNR